MSKTYHIFISHAWKYDEHYNKVVQWLNESDIFWKNYSVPQHDPVDANNTTKLKAALTNQIKPASGILIVAGMYAAHSTWIDYEIDEAVRLGKTIIGIEPWGQERIPKKIQDNAIRMVGWNSSPIIKAVKELL
ncbi:MAG: TIR domain-containing protein [Negativicutes bacterium]|nr:TIR domain-containing protein [Negativicutes bacterium]